MPLKVVNIILVHSVALSDAGQVKTNVIHETFIYICKQVGLNVLSITIKIALHFAAHYLL